MFSCIVMLLLRWMSQDFAIVFPNSLVGHFWLHSNMGRTHAECQIWKVIWSAVIFSSMEGEEQLYFQTTYC
ncbi:hypothetical protein GLYMA_10G181850v4 [Glycine max]|nr:hypothetical protein GLYMA_10G181850v4 [Glycine max]KAH1138894.1 hypothetical protein GYH30_028378 [Glycine max]